jgi:NADH-quinone oxidoreductase subunit M
MDLTHNILSILVWLPIFGGAAVLLVGDAGSGATPRAASMRILALAVSVLTLALSVFLYTDFDNTATAMQFVERAPWIDAFRIE